MHHLAIQNTYQQLQLALFEGSQCKAIKTLDKIHASSHTIPTLETLLKEHTLTLKDLSFIAVNQGPGPFTTLRVVIATANGLSFATGVPLVGVDGFDAMLTDRTPTQTAILLNAFAGDLYYALADKNGIFKRGYEKKDTLITRIKETFKQGSIVLTGNGVLLIHDELMKEFSSRAIIETPLQETALIESIGKLGLDNYTQNKISYQLQPLYLKKATPAHFSPGAATQ